LFFEREPGVVPAVTISRAIRFHEELDSFVTFTEILQRALEKEGPAKPKKSKDFKVSKITILDMFKPEKTGKTGPTSPIAPTTNPFDNFVDTKSSAALAALGVSPKKYVRGSRKLG
jgi:hypothetical protein